MTQSRRITRRRFLHKSAALAGLAAAPAFVPSHVLGANGTPAANEQLRIGVIGCGVRGKFLIGNLPEGVRVAAICDWTPARIAETLAPEGKNLENLERFRDRDAQLCRTYQDYRKLLDNPQLDAVIIATPDHHHVQAALLALQAGLDVYLEKPMTLVIAEGRVLANAVQKTGRVLQVGSHQRTMEYNRFACEFVRDGGLGKVSRAVVQNDPGPLMMPTFPEQPLPEGADWNLFCGPAPLRPYHDRVWMKDVFKVDGLSWRGWDFWQDYSGHIMTNWGAHTVDMVQYALGKDHTGPVDIQLRQPTADVRELAQEYKKLTLPPQTSGTGSYDERRFWPATMRYADGLELSLENGILEGWEWAFHGELGTMFITRNNFRTDPPDLVARGPDPQLRVKWGEKGLIARPHIENWIECIKSRGAPNAPVEVGHRTVTICHLVNIARQLNRSLKWDPDRERVLGDDEANQLLNRPRRAGFELPAVG